MSYLNRLIDFAEKICLLGSAVSILLIMFLTTFDVFLRKLTTSSVPSLFEFTTDYLMVALVFLSLSYVYKTGGHVRVTLFTGIIPHIIKTPLNRIKDGLGLIFFALIAVAGWKNAMLAYDFQEVSSSLLAYPLAPAFFLVPVGAGLTCIRIFQTLIAPSSTGDREK